MRHQNNFSSNDPLSLCLYFSLPLTLALSLTIHASSNKSRARDTPTQSRTPQSARQTPAVAPDTQGRTVGQNLSEVSKVNPTPSHPAHPATHGTPENSLVTILGMSEGLFGALFGALIGGILSLVGSIVATRWSISAANRKEQENERKQVDAIKALLKLEAEQNLNLLTDFWDKVGKYNFSVDDPELKVQEMARQFVSLPLPYWRRSVWDGQPTLLTNALTVPLVKSFHEFYERLDLITSTRELLKNIEGVTRPDESLATSTGQSFDKEAAKLMPHCAAIVEKTKTETASLLSNL